MAKTEVYGANPNAWVVEDLPNHVGNIWFVDSNAVGAADDTAHGTSPDTPFLTLDYAIGRCTANHGDTIYLMPGHSQAIGAGQCFIERNVRVVGLGWGVDRPSFTFTHNDASIVLNADHCSIENLLLIVDLDGVDALVQIDAANCRVENCELREGAGKQADCYISIDCAANVADGTIIRGCKIISVAAGASYGIGININGQDHIVIEDNVVWGNYLLNSVNIVAVGNNYLVRNNLIANLNALGVPLWFTNGPGIGGMCVGNRFVDLSGTTTFPSGLFFCLDNTVVSSIDTNDRPVPYEVAEPLWPTEYLDSDSLSSSVGEKTADGVVVTRATAALPQTAAVSLFTVTGRVLLKRLVGVVTTAIGAVPNVTHLQLNSTGAGATTDLCLAVAGLDVDGDVADTNYTITGAFGDAMVATTDIPMVSTAYQIVLPPGDLEVECAGNDGGGGRVRWTATYVPLEDGAQMVAA